jgi:hypothetical protein
MDRLRLLRVTATRFPRFKGGTDSDKQARLPRRTLVVGYPPCPQGAMFAVPGIAACAGVVVPVPVVSGARS